MSLRRNSFSLDVCNHYLTKQGNLHEIQWNITPSPWRTSRIFPPATAAVLPSTALLSPQQPRGFHPWPFCIASMLKSPLWTAYTSLPPRLHSQDHGLLQHLWSWPCLRPTSPPPILYTSDTIICITYATGGVVNHDDVQYHHKLPWTDVISASGWGVGPPQIYGAKFSSKQLVSSLPVVYTTINVWFCLREWRGWVFILWVELIKVSFTSFSFYHVNV